MHAGFGSEAKPSLNGLEDSIFETLGDGKSRFEDFSIKTVEHVDHPGYLTKPPELVRKIKFCLNRMVEKGINLQYGITFSTLNRFADPVERNTPEHFRLQSCFADFVIAAISDPH